MYIVKERVAIVWIQFDKEKASDVLDLIRNHSGDLKLVGPVEGQPTRRHMSVHLPIESEEAFLAGLEQLGI